VYSNFYRHYVTKLLLLVYVFNQFDRKAFDILMEPMRQEFSLTDTQLGFVGGPALALVYACLGVPVARLGDRTRRLTIMTVGIVLWSVVCSLTAIVHQFWALALVRAGVGVGEAGFSAIAISVIVDYARDDERARAVSNFSLALGIASLLSNLVGGWINQLYGWRPIFLIAGLPGILLAVLMAATVQEPPRRLASNPKEADWVPLRAVLSTLWRRRSLRHLAVAQGVSNLAMCAATGWATVFFIRQHHMQTGELGSWLAVADGVGGIASIWLSGLVTAHFGAKDPRMRTSLLALAALLVVPLALLTIWLPSKTGALVSYLVLNLPLLFYMGPTTALVQDLVGPSMRATTASIFFLLQVMLGSVLGLQLTGALSDILTPLFSEPVAGLRWSMTLGTLFAFWAAAHFWMAGRTVREDIGEVRGDAGVTCESRFA